MITLFYTVLLMSLGFTAFALCILVALFAEEITDLLIPSELWRGVD